MMIRNSALLIALFFCLQTFVLMVYLPGEDDKRPLTGQVDIDSPQTDKQTDKMLREIQGVKEMLAYQTWPAATDTQQTPVLDTARLTSEVRAVIKQELRIQLKDLLSGINIQAVDDTNSAADEANDGVAYEAALTTVEQAISDGVWTIENSTAVIPHLSGLSLSQREMLSSKYVEAVNAGLIDLRTSNAVPPF